MQCSSAVVRLVLAIRVLIMPLALGAMFVHHDRADTDHYQFTERYVDIEVELNVPDRDGKPGRNHRVASVVLHPDWLRWPSPSHDIALVELAEPSPKLHSPQART
jgi:hypothetical protein